MAAVFPKNEKIKVPIVSNVKELRQKKNTSGAHDKSRAYGDMNGFAGKNAERFEIDHQKKSIKNCSRQSGQVRLTFFKKRCSKQNGYCTASSVKVSKLPARWKTPEWHRCELAERPGGAPFAKQFEAPPAV